MQDSQIDLKLCLGLRVKLDASSVGMQCYRKRRRVLDTPTNDFKNKVSVLILVVKRTNDQTKFVSVRHTVTR